jgi:predicted RNA-binding Zn-ribbon protein involved in translation (DUF1610 family)
MGVPYFERSSREFSCHSCSWRGPGSQLKQGELFAQLVEYDCPQCGERVTFASFPTYAETQAAAEAGNAEAIEGLAGIDEAKRRWDRVLETRRSAVAAPAELVDLDVRCELTLVDDDDGEPWIVLLANGHELHRELAAWESAEPAHRLLAMMRERYGERLRAFDYSPAMLYLGGDRLASIDELRRLVADLPEIDS